MYFSSDFIPYISLFPVVHWVSLIQFSFYLSQTLTSLGLVTGNFLSSLGGVMFLKGLYSCPHITKSHLLSHWQLWWKKYFLSILQKISEAFTNTMDTRAPHFLFTVWGQLSALNAFSPVLKIRPSENNLPFSMAVIGAYICVPSPSSTGFGLFWAYAY